MEPTTGADRQLDRVVDELKRELEAKSRELAEAREQQAATAGILVAISSSPADLRRVFAEIAVSAARLCDAYDASIAQVDGDSLRLVAHHGPIPTTAAVGQFTLPLVRGFVTGRAVLDRQTIHVADLQAEIDEYPQGSDLARRLGFRTVLHQPLMRSGKAIGVIFIRRTEVRPFTDRQIDLLKTFADQAVIAIENARLFEAEQASKRELTERTRELTETLEYQTATSEVLNVISRSPNELQPVLDTIVVMAERLCAAEYALVRLERDGLYHVMARHALNPDEVDNVPGTPVPADRSSVSGKAVSECRTVHVHDVLADPEDTYAVSMGVPARTILGVPLIRNGKAIGVIVVFRRTVKPFTQRQVDLIATFANQAVIAINNVGLFEEVRARNRDLTALGEVGRAVGSTLDLNVVLKTIVERAIELSGTDAGSIFYYRPEVVGFELGETVGLDEEVVARLRRLEIATDQTGLGEAIAKRQPLQIPDLTQHSSDSLRDAVLQAGFRASLIVPLFGADGPLGTLVLRRRQPGEFPPAVVNLMQSFADQSAIALENARLFEEIARKGRELEIASQHKSQFVANMSHELRTPLAAILGYAELIQEGFYGPLPEKSLDALTRIRSNGKHLLGLINTVLDIAKIESGQFSLNMAEYAMDSVVETVRAATESLAQNKRLALTTDVAKSLPVGLGDEQRLTQVLLNLVGNAIKFTDAGEVRVTAKANNGHFAVCVADTGPGIPEHERTRIFEQFHQIDSSNSKAKGGTGLGLAIAKQIVEMHGGRIWVESTVGKGSTFQMEIPARAQVARSA